MSPEPVAGPSQPNKKTRSRAGCYTCRRRKKLCDNQRPTCGSCNRLGIPCVFPKLYLNSSGDLVPSPQPNGRTKRKASPTPTPTQDAIPLDTPSTEFAPSAAPWAPQWDSDTGNFVDNPNSNPNPNTHLNVPSDPASIPPAFLSPDLDPTASSLFDILQELGLSVSNANENPVAQAQTWVDTIMEEPLPDPTKVIKNAPPPCLDPPRPPILHSSSVNDPSKVFNQIELMNHLPVLLAHFVNSFSRVVSVLGPGDNSLVTYIMPLASRSQLIMCALVGWAASHLSILGNPYIAMADAAVETVETQVKDLEGVESMTEEQQEENLMALLILGGIYVCRGDVRDWVKRLPETRQILRAASANRDVATSQTWRSIAMNLVYHDVLSSLATCENPGLPFDFYQQILAASDCSPDVYMGVAMQIFGILGEVAVLASEIDSILALPTSPEQHRKLNAALSKQYSILARLRAVETPMGAFSSDQMHLLIGFQINKIATELYLRQTVLHASSADLCSRSLCYRIMQHMREILGTPSSSQMLLPLFVCGVNTWDHEEREEIVSIFNKFNDRVKTGNIQAVYSLLLEVWKRDPDGQTFVDWRKVADESDTVISFA